VVELTTFEVQHRKRTNKIPLPIGARSGTGKSCSDGKIRSEKFIRAPEFLLIYNTMRLFADECLLSRIRTAVTGHPYFGIWGRWAL